MTEPDRLAAEYVLGLLEGEDLLAARARAASEPAFADAIAWWDAQLAPLLDQIEGAAPPADLWQRIEAICASPDSNGEVITLRRSLRLWQWTAGLSAAASVAILLFAGMFLQLPTTPAVDAPPMAASIPIADTDLRLAVTYLPDRREMLVSASGLTADGVHDHELWLVPQNGAAYSLGVIAPGEERRSLVDVAAARAMHDGAKVLLTREPLGGARDKSAPGPVVADGKLATI